MKLSAAIVGTAAGPLEQPIDARWLMAHAAALGETAEERFDTTRPGGVVAHPLFPVCYEWPLAVLLRARLGDDIASRSVHATHDLTLHRLPRPGDRLRTTAVVTLVEPRAPGAYVLTRFETIDAAGDRVSTTVYGSLYRGVACEGGPRRPARSTSGRPDAKEPSAGPRPGAGEADGAPDWSVPVAIAPALAHVYSECARIWNPIHTDRAVARSAGLPDIILHGTATLALAVSRILGRLPAAATVSRVACRFAGMVGLPSTITVEGWAVGGSVDGPAVRFQVLDAEGRPAVTRGVVVLASMTKPGG
jgi:acyl dehydratase